MQEKIISDMQSWLDSEIEDIKNDARTHFGVELTQKQIIEIKKEQIKSALKKLFSSFCVSSFRTKNINDFSFVVSFHFFFSCS